MKTATLERAIARLKKGQDAAFETLYDATKERVYYTLLSILKNPVDVDDVMQETYLKVLENIHRYEANTQFAAWINQIARRTAFDHLRKTQRTEPLDVEDYNPQLRVDNKMEKQYYVQTLIASLEEVDREIVIRKIFFQETHKTIAKALDLPLGTVTWRYQQALKYLREKEEANERQIL